MGEEYANRIIKNRCFPDSLSKAYKDIDDFIKSNERLKDAYKIANGGFFGRFYYRDIEELTMKDIRKVPDMLSYLEDIKIEKALARKAENDKTK